MRSGGFPCQNEGNGVGIRTSGITKYFNITIRNGTIQGMGDKGITLQGDSILVEYMHIRSNGGSGIFVGSGFTGNNVIVQRNNVQLNDGIGIRLDGGLVANNVVTQNPNGAIAFSFSTFGGFTQNVLTANGTPQISGNGTNLGQNLCNGAACPGAVY